MKLNEYVEYDATGLADLVRAGEVTPVELIRLAREAHDAVNPRINAVIEFYEDAETAAGVDGGLFQGVPFLRKDLGFSEAGRLEEKGSRLFKGHRCATDSYFTQRVRAGGLRTVGRTTTPEFGASGMSESFLNGVTGNPWNLKRSAGGSSSGSAAAVAAGIAPIASASDSGGSIRTPAAWCGLVGLNPSRGRLSSGPDNQDPMFGLARQSVVCRTVRDMAAALDVLSGPYPGDPFIIVQPRRSYVEELSQPTGKLRVGVARTKWGSVEIEPEILAALDATAALLEQMGHEVAEFKTPDEFEAYSKIMLSMSDLHADWFEATAQAMGRKLGPETLEPVNIKLYEHGRNLPLSHIDKVLEGLRSMRVRVGEAIDAFDILLTPTMPKVAPPHGGRFCTTNPTTTAQEYMEADASFYSQLGIFNVTGHPSVSLPSGLGADGLPIGLQIVGRFGDEATLVRVSRDLEEARPWRAVRPKVHAGAIG